MDIDFHTAAHFDRLRREFAHLDPTSISRHVPSSEPLPDMPAYHASFPKAQDRGVGIISMLLRAITKSKDKDAELEYMTACLRAISSPSTPGLRIVCVYGNCGVGKSSFINAVLGVEDASLKAS